MACADDYAGPLDGLPESLDACERVFYLGGEYYTVGPRHHYFYGTFNDLDLKTFPGSSTKVGFRVVRDLPDQRALW